MANARRAIGAALVSALIAACSSDSSSDDDGTCADVAGSWNLFGTCSDDACDITQQGCNLTVSCSPSGTVYKGTVSGEHVTFERSGRSCTVSVNGVSASGSCTELGVACSWLASCTAGSCTSATGTGGTTSGVDCGPACLAIVGCCPTMSAFNCQIGCEKTSALPTCKPCYENLACGALVPCLRANCSLPQKECPGS